MGGSGYASGSGYSSSGGGLTPSGIAYQRPILTGQTTSYRTGDDAWHLANGTYDYTPPTYPDSYAQLDNADATPFITLLNNNAYGNKNRFTDENGLQVYGSGLKIDHLTGLMWYTVHASGKWNQAIDAAAASSQGGFNDWRIPSDQELTSVDNKAFTFAFNYTPFLCSASTLWTSTTYATTTTAAYRATNNGIFGAQMKTNSQDYILVRNHYV